jgi:prepilin-type processing-associated H-X9-DG protein
MRRKVILSALLSLIFVGPLFADPPKDAIERVKWARDRTVSQNNLKQIVLAFLNHEAAIRTFPGDVVDKNGKPLLSWRVQILPYLEQQRLYQQFKLDEPWDSENNKKLLEEMPKIYAPVRGKADKGKTFYQAFSGSGALMGGKAVKIVDITDGTSQTFSAIEAGEAVEWTKPADIAFDPKKPLPKLGGIFDGDFNVAMCDGSVRYVAKGVKEENLKKFITIAGGEVIGDKDLNPEK